MLGDGVGCHHPFSSCLPLTPLSPCCPTCVVQLLPPTSPAAPAPPRPQTLRLPPPRLHPCSPPRLPSLEPHFLGRSTPTAAPPHLSADIKPSALTCLLPPPKSQAFLHLTPCPSTPSAPNLVRPLTLHKPCRSAPSAPHCCHPPFSKCSRSVVAAIFHPLLPHNLCRPLRAIPHDPNPCCLQTCGLTSDMRIPTPLESGPLRRVLGMQGAAFMNRQD